MRLLLVEDDGDVAETLTAYLERQGFVVDRADTLAMAQDALLDDELDLGLLDRGRPDGDGVSLIGYAQAHKRPQRFLLLSALAGIDDKVTGLELGAHDYIAKPFEPRELVARIRVAMRPDPPRCRGRWLLRQRRPHVAPPVGGAGAGHADDAGRGARPARYAGDAGVWL